MKRTSKSEKKCDPGNRELSNGGASWLTIHVVLLSAEGENAPITSPPNSISGEAMPPAGERQAFSISPVRRPLSQRHLRNQLANDPSFSDFTDALTLERDQRPPLSFCESCTALRSAA